jgi:putative membrane protein
MRNLVIVIVALAAFALVSAALRYWFFRYSIVGDSILIRDGVFNRKQLDLGFDRIQAVNTRQNPLYRLLGLTTVTFDSAGSSAVEGYLPAVRSEIAKDLRARIRRMPTRTDVAGPGASPAPTTGAAQLMRLSPGDIVLAGLSSGRVFLLLALLGPLGQVAEREIGQRIEEAAVIETLSVIAPDAGLGVLLVLAFIALLLLLLASVVGAFLRYHKFVVTADGDVVRSAGGLFTRHEHSVNQAKVQSVAITRNAMLLLFGRLRLRVRQAGGGREAGNRDFLVPIARAAEVQAVGREIFREEFDESLLHSRSTGFRPVSRRYVRSRTLLFGVLPGTAAGVLLWPALGTVALLALAWIPVCAVLAWQVHRRLGFAPGTEAIAVRSGFIGSRVVVWLYRKVQRINVTQSPFQRRMNLATLRIHLAAGSVRIPFIDHETARQLRDYTLYKIESSPLPWH